MRRIGWEGHVNIKKYRTIAGRLAPGVARKISWDTAAAVYGGQEGFRLPPEADVSLWHLLEVVLADGVVRLQSVNGLCRQQRRHPLLVPSPLGVMDQTNLLLVAFDQLGDEVSR